jgi:hypothetical protein
MRAEAASFARIFFVQAFRLILFVEVSEFSRIDYVAN